MGLFGNRQKKREEQNKMHNIEIELALIKQGIVECRREQVMAKVNGEYYDIEELNILKNDFEKADMLTRELRSSRSTDEFLDSYYEQILILKRKYR